MEGSVGAANEGHDVRGRSRGPVAVAVDRLNLALRGATRTSDEAIEAKVDAGESVRPVREDRIRLVLACSVARREPSPRVRDPPVLEISGVRGEGGGRFSRADRLIEPRLRAGR